MNKIKNIDKVFKFIPAKGSDKLIIYFSSASVIDLEGVRELAEFDDINQLFVRDPYRNWYNGQIDGFVKDADELKEKISEVTKSFSLDKITAAGSSMGAYAAILFGCLLGVKRIVAVAPQIVLHPNMPKTPAQDVKYNDLKKIITNNKAETFIDIWFGAGELIDIYQVLPCSKLNNVTVYTVNDSMHNVLSFFKGCSILKDFFNYVVTGEKFDFFNDTALPKIKVKDLCEGFESFYIDQNYKKSIDILEPIAQTSRLPSLYFFLAVAYDRLAEYKIAINYLKKATVYGYRNYDACYMLGLLYFKIKKYSLAIEQIKAAISFCPAPHSQYTAQLCALLRLNGSIGEAITFGLQALKIDSKNVLASFQLGLLFYKRKNYAESIKYLSITLDGKPNWEAAKIHLANSIKALLKSSPEIKKVFSITQKYDLPLLKELS